MILSGKPAVYGGRISGRQERGLKVNPIYHDSNSSIQRSGQGHKDHNGNMNGIYLEMYETFPSRTDKNANVTVPKVNTGSKDTAVLNEHGNDLDPKDAVETKVITMQPALLGPGSDLDPKVPVIIQQATTQNEAHTQDNIKIDVPNGYQSDDILSNLKKQKVPNGNYTLLGYNNEGYVNNENEIEGNSTSGDVLQDNHQKSLEVCNSIDSSPSKSSVTSGGSPAKNGKFLTEVSVHVIEYSQDPAKSVKLEAFGNENVKDVDLTDLKTAIGSDQPNHEAVLHTQEGKSPDAKIEILDDIETTQNRIATDNIQNKNDICATDLQNVIISLEEEKTSHNINPLEIQPHEGNITESKSTKYTKSSALDSNTVVKKAKKSDSKDSEEGESSTKTLKSILTNASPIISSKVPDDIRKHTKSDSEIQEAKCVKFSEDTVFNENKPKKYKNERIDRINLRNIYHGRISSDSAMAKLNPLFSDDLEEYDHDSLTDDEKVAYRLSIRKMMESKGKNGSLNTPAYMDKYLVLRTQGLKGIDHDIEKLPVVPVKDRLIQRTIRKKRRKLIVKWTLVVITVIIITATATVVGVYFKNNG